jgi:hypothetical protein
MRKSGLDQVPIGVAIRLGTPAGNARGDIPRGLGDDELNRQWPGGRRLARCVPTRVFDNMSAGNPREPPTL